MTSPEREAFEQIRAEYTRLDLTTPSGREQHKRFLRARRAAYRQENYETYYAQWLENTARQLGCDEADIHLLSLDETDRLEDQFDVLFWDRVRASSLPFYRWYFPLSREKPIADLFAVLLSHVPETEVVLMKLRTSDFGAVVTTSSETFHRALAIVDKKDYNFIWVMTPDTLNGFSPRTTQDHFGARADGEAPYVYAFDVWGEWAVILEPYEEGRAAEPFAPQEWSFTARPT